MGVHQAALTDAQLIEASEHDPNQFGEIADRHFAEIHGYIARRVGRDLAADLGSETFAIAFESRRRYDCTRSDARPWLFGIATNLIRRHRRDEVRKLSAYQRAGQGIPGVAEDADLTVDQLDRLSRLAEVASGFSKLEPDHRDALYLVAVSELSYQQAADALGVPVGTIHSRVARARRELRDLTQGNGQVEESPPTRTNERQ
jgi:RNA polymerase sigma-70 factor (ECF subfamily)